MPSRSVARLLVLAVLAFFSPAPLSAQIPETPAVVVGAVENLYLRPDETSPVDDQVILGEHVTVVETTAGFARVRTRSGNAAWIPERALRRGAGAAAGRVARVRSPLAHAYASPDFTETRPLLTAPLGARLELLESVALDGHAWAKVALPDGRVGFFAATDVAIEDAGAQPALGAPADWLALGRRFLEAPYTWGGTTPLGFDCSGLVYRILEQHGVVLMRNSSQMCFRDPQLVPVAFEKLQAGDLLFFGTESRIDHMGMWLGDGRVLQATAYGTPSTQITEFATSPRLKDRFRYARRLAALAGAQKPGLLSEAARQRLESVLSDLAAKGGASYGIYFKDLAGGGTIALGADRVMHAASTMKTPILLELLRRVDAGELRLDQELPVRNEFHSLVDGSAFSIGLEPEADGPASEKLGSSATLEFLAREMIQRSSNLATNVLLSMLGPDAVQRFTDALGAPSVKVRRCVEDGKAYEKGLNNETDARGMGAVMEACVRSDRLKAASRDKAWEILSGQFWNEQIPKGLHLQSGAVVAHKTGSISSVQHDAAIVRLPDGREYVLVLLANDFGANEAGRQRVFETTRAMSRAVWEAMIAPQ
ncbi:MAG: serine hydrolase [Vicinamibacteria bacterium]